MATTSLFLRGLATCLFCLAVQFAPPAAAQENSNTADQESSKLVDTQLSTSTNSTADNLERNRLQQELRNLLAENKRINQEKIQYLENQSNRVFWTKCFIGFLVFMMLVSLFSFWRLHVQRKFQTGLDALTTSFRHFQDSIFSLSFIDTSGYSTAGNSSSFQLSQTDLDQLHQDSGLPSQANSRLNSQLNSQFNSSLHRSLNPTTTGRGDEFTDIRGFFDAWLNVYKPGDPRYEQALAAANKPESARPWLQMLDSFRQNSDHSGFENIRKEIKKFFNVKINPWDVRALGEQKQLSDYPHIVQKILDLWPTDEVVTYLERLMHNSRMSPREGFDLTMFQQLESLMELASRPDRPRQLQQLRSIGIADFLFKPSSTSQSNTKHMAAPTITDRPLPSAPAVANASPTAILVNAAPPAEVTVTTVPATPSVPISTSSTPAPAVTTTSNTTSKITSEESSATVTPTVNVSTRAPVTLAIAQDEKTQFNANDVRLRLATAYLEIGDTEGACLLLEDVIKEAVPAQQEQARSLLTEIEAKKARTCGDNEKIYFH